MADETLTNEEYWNQAGQALGREFVSENLDPAAAQELASLIDIARSGFEVPSNESGYAVYQLEKLSGLSVDDLIEKISTDAGAAELAQDTSTLIQTHIAIQISGLSSAVIEEGYDAGRIATDSVSLGLAHHIYDIENGPGAWAARVRDEIEEEHGDEMSDAEYAARTDLLNITAEFGAASPELLEAASRYYEEFPSLNGNREIEVNVREQIQKIQSAERIIERITADEDMTDDQKSDMIFAHQISLDEAQERLAIWMPRWAHGMTKPIRDHNTNYKLAETLYDRLSETDEFKFNAEVEYNRLAELDGRVSWAEHVEALRQPLVDNVESANNPRAKRNAQSALNNFNEAELLDEWADGHIAQKAYISQFDLSVYEQYGLDAGLFDALDFQSKREDEDMSASLSDADKSAAAQRFGEAWLTASEIVYDERKGREPGAWAERRAELEAQGVSETEILAELAKDGEWGARWHDGNWVSAMRTEGRSDEYQAAVSYLVKLDAYTRYEWGNDLFQDIGVGASDPLTVVSIGGALVVGVYTGGSGAAPTWTAMNLARAGLMASVSGAAEGGITERLTATAGQNSEVALGLRAHVNQGEINQRTQSGILMGGAMGAGFFGVGHGLGRGGKAILQNTSIGRHIAASTTNARTRVTATARDLFGRAPQAETAIDLPLAPTLGPRVDAQQTSTPALFAGQDTPPSRLELPASLRTPDADAAPTAPGAAPEAPIVADAAASATARADAPSAAAPTPAAVNTSGLVASVMNMGRRLNDAIPFTLEVKPYDPTVLSANPMDWIRARWKGATPAPAPRASSTARVNEIKNTVRSLNQLLKRDLDLLLTEGTADELRFNLTGRPPAAAGDPQTPGTDINKVLNRHLSRIDGIINSLDSADSPLTTADQAHLTSLLGRVRERADTYTRQQYTNTINAELASPKYAYTAPTGRRGSTANSRTVKHFHDNISAIVQKYHDTLNGDLGGRTFDEVASDAMDILDAEVLKLHQSLTRMGHPDAGRAFNLASEKAEYSYGTYERGINITGLQQDGLRVTLEQTSDLARNMRRLGSQPALQDFMTRLTNRVNDPDNNIAHEHDALITAGWGSRIIGRDAAGNFPIGLTSKSQVNQLRYQIEEGGNIFSRDASPSAFALGNAENTGNSLKTLFFRHSPNDPNYDEDMAKEFLRAIKSGLSISDILFELNTAVSKADRTPGYNASSPFQSMTGILDEFKKLLHSEKDASGNKTVNSIELADGSIEILDPKFSTILQRLSLQEARFWAFNSEGGPTSFLLGTDAGNERGMTPRRRREHTANALARQNIATRYSKDPSKPGSSSAGTARDAGKARFLDSLWHLAIGDNVDMAATRTEMIGKRTKDEAGNPAQFMYQWHGGGENSATTMLGKTWNALKRPSKIIYRLSGFDVIPTAIRLAGDHRMGGNVQLLKHTNPLAMAYGVNAAISGSLLYGLGANPLVYIYNAVDDAWQGDWVSAVSPFHDSPEKGATTTTTTNTTETTQEAVDSDLLAEATAAMQVYFDAGEASGDAKFMVAGDDRFITDGLLNTGSKTEQRLIGRAAHILANESPNFIFDPAKQSDAWDQAVTAVAAEDADQGLRNAIVSGLVTHYGMEEDDATARMDRPITGSDGKPVDDSSIFFLLRDVATASGSRYEQAFKTPNIPYQIAKSDIDAQILIHGQEQQEVEIIQQEAAARAARLTAATTKTTAWLTANVTEFGELPEATRNASIAAVAGTLADVTKPDGTFLAPDDYDDLTTIVVTDPAATPPVTKTLSQIYAEAKFKIDAQIAKIKAENGGVIPNEDDTPGFTGLPNAPSAKILLAEAGQSALNLANTVLDHNNDGVGAHIDTDIGRTISGGVQSVWRAAVNAHSNMGQTPGGQKTLNGIYAFGGAMFAPFILSKLPGFGWLNARGIRPLIMVAAFFLGWKALNPGGYLNGQSAPTRRATPGTGGSGTGEIGETEERKWPDGIIREASATDDKPGVVATNASYQDGEETGEGEQSGGETGGFVMNSLIPTVGEVQHGSDIPVAMNADYSEEEQTELETDITDAEAVLDGTSHFAVMTNSDGQESSTFASPSTVAAIKLVTNSGAHVTNAVMGTPAEDEDLNANVTAINANGDVSDYNVSVDGKPVITVDPDIAILAAANVSHAPTQPRMAS